MASYGVELGKRVRQDVVEGPDRLRRLHHIEASHLFRGHRTQRWCPQTVELNREADAEKTRAKVRRELDEVLVFRKDLEQVMQ